METKSINFFSSEKKHGWGHYQFAFDIPNNRFIHKNRLNGFNLEDDLDLVLIDVNEYTGYCFEWSIYFKGVQIYKSKGSIQGFAYSVKEHLGKLNAKLSSGEFMKMFDMYKFFKA